MNASTVDAYPILDRGEPGLYPRKQKDQGSVYLEWGASLYGIVGN